MAAAAVVPVQIDEFLIKQKQLHFYFEPENALELILQENAYVFLHLYRLMRSFSSYVCFIKVVFFLQTNSKLVIAATATVPQPIVVARHIRRRLYCQPLSRHNFTLFISV